MGVNRGTRQGLPGLGHMLSAALTWDCDSGARNVHVRERHAQGHGEKGEMRRREVEQRHKHGTEMSRDGIQM